MIKLGDIFKKCVVKKLSRISKETLFGLIIKNTKICLQKKVINYMLKKNFKFKKCLV